MATVAAILAFMLRASFGIGVAAFVSACIAHLVLHFCIDRERVKEETGEPGWKIFGSVLAPAEYYKAEARAFWEIQRVGRKVAMICLVLCLFFMLIVVVLARLAG